ncbi:hypothetical protein CF642_37995, partial [Burkholderia pseudomallei]
MIDLMVWRTVICLCYIDLTCINNDSQLRHASMPRGFRQPVETRVAVRTHTAKVNTDYRRAKLDSLASEHPD